MNEEDSGPWSLVRGSWFDGDQGRGTKDRERRRCYAASPTLKRAKRETVMFSPSFATT